MRIDKTKKVNAPKRVYLLLLITLFCFTTMSAQQQGKASFYSKRSVGAKTSNGERLNNDSLTCAHLTYPFGSVLRVTNNSNHKQVLVRVNDRGPHGRNRIIDLSYKAAQSLGMIAQGIANVTVELITKPISVTSLIP